MSDDNRRDEEKPKPQPPKPQPSKNRTVAPKVGFGRVQAEVNRKEDEE